MAHSTSNDKTNLEWINTLPEPQRSEILKNADKEKLKWYNSCLEFALKDMEAVTPK